VALEDPDVPEELLGPVYSSVSPLRAVEILAFAPVTTTELSVALRCHQRTARRLLERLVVEGWVRRVSGPRPRYELTLRAVAMAAQAQRRSAFAQAALAFAAEAAERLERPAHVAIPCYGQLLCLASSAGAPARRGDLLDIAGSAPGRVLLANRRPWREMLITRLELDEQQRAGLDEVRRLGYAWVEEQIAVPVWWREEGVLGALAITGIAGEQVGAIAALARSILTCCDPHRAARRAGA
jgi:DNA-binding IclR family transcriptional regulator